MGHRNASRPARQLRIIGGEWRGRTFRFPPDSGIRPTPDRVRETLYNWLQGRIRGARVLDLFAGSGALGLEALSRGAAEVQFVERDRAAARAIAATLAVFGARTLQVAEADALQFLAGPASAFDLVLLDPPFDSDLLALATQSLEGRGWLVPEALVYLEAPAAMPLPALPPAWRLAKSGRAGDVGYHLVQRSTEGTDRA